MSKSTVQLICASLFITICVLLSVVMTQTQTDVTEVHQSSVFVGKAHAQYLYTDVGVSNKSSEFHYDKVQPLENYSGALSSYVVNSNSCGVKETIYYSIEHISGKRQSLYSAFSISDEFCHSGNISRKELIFLEKDKQGWILKASHPIYEDYLGKELIINVYHNKFHNYDLAKLVHPLLEPIYYSSKDELGDYFLEKGIQSGKLMLIKDDIYAKKGIYLDDLKSELKMADAE